jgi:outer membrane protein assembly factor BamB
MRIMVLALLGMLVVAAIAAPTAAATSNDKCAVLIDFGNGQVEWVDVIVTQGMNAFNATQQAAQQLGLAFVAPGGFVSSIGGYAGNWPNEVWNFWIWDPGTGQWDMPWVGPSDILANSTPAVAWSYAAYVDTVSFTPPHAPLATPDHRYPWTSFRHDVFNTGSQPVYAPNNLTLAWEKDLGNGAIDTAVVAANGFEYVITGGRLNETTYAFETNSSVFCLNSTNGQVWRADIGIGYQVGSPLLYGGMVVVPSADGKVYAFNAMTGAQLWYFETGSEMSMGVTSSPIAYCNMIIFGAGNGKVFALHENGTQAWNVSVASGIYSSSPAVRNGTIYIGAENGRLYALASNGTGQVWSVPLGGKVRGSPILTQNEIVISYLNYTGSAPTSGGLAAVSYSGQLKWQTTTNVTPASAVLTSKGFASVCSMRASMIGFDGKLLWNLGLGTTFAGAAPASVNGSIYLVTNEGTSRLLAISDQGELYYQKALLPAQYALSAPTVADGKLFVSCDNGNVYAFNLNSVAPVAHATWSVNDKAGHFVAQTSAGTLFHYSWDFGDGNKSTTPVADHTYAKTGSYNAVLTVTNPAGESSYQQFVVYVNATASASDNTALIVGGLIVVVVVVVALAAVTLRRRK